MSRFSSKVPPSVHRLFRLPWSRARMLRDVNDEMDFHLEMRVAEFRTLGLTETAARAEAVRRFGDVDDFRDYSTRVGERRARLDRLIEWFAEWAQDVRFAGRQFQKAPGVTAIAILTMALGIGANTAIFSVVHHLLLAPLPYPDGNRIVMLQMAAGDGDMRFPVNANLMTAWQARAHTIDAFAAAGRRRVRLSDEPGDTASGALITPAYLRMLGVQPALGRAFTVDESRPGGSSVAMIGYSLWQTRYGGRRSVLDSAIQVDGRLRIIIGVTPPEMSIPMSQREAPAIWLPMSLDSASGNVGMFARLRPRVTPGAASKELQAIVAGLPDPSPYARMQARAMRAQEFLDPREARTVRILFAAVGLLLLIACANVANLLLARAWARRREFAIRASLGAGRARLVRQVLTESVSLGLMGGALGVLIAWQSLRIIIAMRPPALENLAGVHLEPAVLLWSAAISVGTGVLFGSAPAMLSVARFVGDALRAEARSGSGNVAARRMRGGLVVVELALSVVLLVGAGLLVRSFVALQQMPIGFDPRNLVSVGAMARLRTDGNRIVAIRQAIVDRVRAIPGVTGADLGTLPGSGWSVANTIQVEGQREPRSTDIRSFTSTFVNPDYFRIARIALLEGRLFDSTATENGPREIVINRSLARRLWPDGRAVGFRIRIGTNQPWSTVIGVVNDIQLPGMRGDRSELQSYSLPLARVPEAAILVRTASPVASVVPSIRRVMAEVDPGLVIGSATTGEMYLNDSLAPSRFAMALLGAFAIVAFLLAAVGLYGVIAYAVSQRTREIGVRVALGARPGAVARLVVGEGVRLAAAGVLIGVVAAGAAARVLDSMLYGVSAADPITFVAIALLLGLIALAASYVPARRALRIDPAEALRSD